MGATLPGAKKEKHTWRFAAHFHAGRYGWKASALACKRVKEAVKEIQNVSGADPALAAEGAIKFMERVNPAFMHVDGSSGALGAAIARAVKELAPIIAQAPADEKTRAKWLERLWEAYQGDGMCYIEDLGDHWGDLCGSVETASRWADELKPLALRRYIDRSSANYATITACYTKSSLKFYI